MVENLIEYAHDWEQYIPAFRIAVGKPSLHSWYNKNLGRLLHVEILSNLWMFLFPWFVLQHLSLGQNMHSFGAVSVKSF